MKKTDKKREVVFWSVNDLISKVESGELDLDTEYQRDVIWLKTKKQLLIDSILQDIDIPKIYLAFFSKEKKFECIDGKQRISSVLDFYNDKLETLLGEHFQNLPNEGRNFLDYKLSMSIIQDPTKEDISELFRRLNIGVPLNGGELMHAMRGDMRDFIFEKIGKRGPFIGKVGIKDFRFSRETAIAQMVFNSIFFREKNNEFKRARFEDIRDFLNKENHKKFDQPTRKKMEKINSILKKLQDVFGKNADKLNRKSAVVSAYLFCEYLIESKGGRNLNEFPKFYFMLLNEMKQQADLINDYQPPTKKILLEEFQKNLQQASAEGYSLKRRQEFLEKAFLHYQKEGEIIGDK